MAVAARPFETYPTLGTEFASVMAVAPLIETEATTALPMPPARGWALTRRLVKRYTRVPLAAGGRKGTP